MERIEQEELDNPRFPRFGKDKRQSTHPPFIRTCHVCRETGHIARECPKSGYLDPNKKTSHQNKPCARSTTHATIGELVSEERIR